MVRSVISNWLGMAITVSVSFLLTPVLVNRLGDFDYGLWALAMSALDSFGLFDVGIRPTVQRFVGRYSGTGQRAALDGMISSAVAIGVGIGIVLLLASLALMYALPVFVRAEGAGREKLMAVVGLLGLNASIAFVARLLAAYVAGFDRFDLFNLEAVLSAILRAAGIVLVLHAGLGLRAVAAVTLVAGLFSLWFSWKLVHHADKGVALTREGVTRERLRELWGVGSYVYVANIGDYLRYGASSMVIARFISVEALSPFSIAVRIMMYFKQGMLGLVGPLLPKMSQLDAQNRGRDLSDLYLQSTRISMLGGLFVGALILLDGRALLRLWLGERFEAAFPTLAVLTAGFALMLGQYPARFLLFARNRHAPLAWWTIGEGLLNAALCVLLAPRYGLLGAAVATTLPMVVVSCGLVPWQAGSLLGVGLGQYVRACLVRPTVACLTLYAIGRALGEQTSAAGPLEFAATVALHFLLFAPLAYGVGLAPGDRAAARERWHRLTAAVRPT